MARNGVWELERITLRYCGSSGSSRGVRQFVENELISFAEKNPQIQFKTIIRGGHPTLYGHYITGYERQRCLKNMTPDDIRFQLQDLRDTLGRKVPRHQDISIGVVEARSVSVQGMWRNSPEMEESMHVERNERKRHLEQQYGLSQILQETGLTGVVTIAKKLFERHEQLRQQAIEAEPKHERVMPTE